MEQVIESLDMTKECGNDGTVFEWAHRFNKWSRAHLRGSVLVQPIRKLPSHNLPESDAGVHFSFMCYDSWLNHYRPVHTILAAMLVELANPDRELKYVEILQEEREAYRDHTYQAWYQKSVGMTVKNMYQASLRKAEAQKKQNAEA